MKTNANLSSRNKIVIDDKQKICFNNAECNIFHLWKLKTHHTSSCGKPPTLLLEHGSSRRKVASSKAWTKHPPSFGLVHQTRYNLLGRWKMLTRWYTQIKLLVWTVSTEDIFNDMCLIYRILKFIVTKGKTRISKNILWFHG